MHLLDAVAELVDAEEPRPEAHGEHGEGRLLPVRAEDRLAVRDHDGAEAVGPAEVVHSVHDWLPTLADVGAREAPDGLLEGVRDAQHGGVVQLLSDDHHPGGQPVRQARGNGAGRVPGDVGDARVGDHLQARA